MSGALPRSGSRFGGAVWSAPSVGATPTAKLPPRSTRVTNMVMAAAVRGESEVVLSVEDFVALIDETVFICRYSADTVRDPLIRDDGAIHFYGPRGPVRVVCGGT